MIREILERLEADNNLRALPGIRAEGKYLYTDGKRYLNLSSNDYLGVSCEPWQREFLQRQTDSDYFLMSNPSSRLVTGNSPDYDTLENLLSEMYGGLAALVLGSGYLANIGVLPALARKGDLILADKRVHASLIDGIRLSEADHKRYNHNDPAHLEKILRKERTRYRNVWVVTESVFSMDGDVAPLRELAALRDCYDLKLYVDEAHAFGVCGPDGLGVAVQEGVSCDILVATLGKAIASQGAFVVCDALTREFLVNKMRTLIFSTALPPLSLRWSAEVLRWLPEMEPQRKHLRSLSEIVSGSRRSTHIIPLMAGTNARAVELARRMREAGFWVTPIRTPTVPQDKARVRLSLSAALTRNEVEKLAEVWKNIGW